MLLHLLGSIEPARRVGGDQGVGRTMTSKRVAVDNNSIRKPERSGHASGSENERRGRTESSGVTAMTGISTEKKV